MNKTLVRVISALAALALMLVVYWGANTTGLMIFGTVVVLLGQWEYAQLCFKDSRSEQFLFISLAAPLFIAIVWTKIDPLESFCLFVVLISSLLLYFRRRHENLEDLLASLFRAQMGLMYCAVFPSFAFALMEKSFGWFFYLLVIVFSGDICAYFFGRAFGNRKIFPHVSPNKSWAGVGGGLFGSMLGAGIYASIYFQYSLPWVISLAAVVGLGAQMGDYFESLLKRVRKVKDSGRLMPGHGGILDRLDGIYFAAPLVFMMTQILERFAK
jgi:phosphatidate cytidylyltransferase